MNTSLQPGEHLLSAAIALATRIAADTGSLPSLDTLALTLGVRPEVLQAVIPDVHHLQVAMAENALRLLVHTATQRVAAVSCGCPINQFEALADAYIEWAARHPCAFHFISAIPAVEFEAQPQLFRYRKSLHEVMHRVLVRAQEQGLLSPEDDPVLLIAICHTYAYGVISKMLIGDLARWTPGSLDDRNAARLALRLFINKCLRRLPLNRTETLL